MITWKCNECDWEDEDTSQQSNCFICGYSTQLQLTKDNILLIIQASEALRRRASHVASLLGHGCDTVEWQETSLEPDYYITRWEESYCGSTDYYSERIPFHYLYMSDEEILKVKAWNVLEEKRRFEEKQKQKAIATALKAVEVAKQKAVTAQQDAQTQLEKAEAQLRAIQGTNENKN